MALNAATYHVSPNGNDEASGSAGFPFCTINRAAMTAQTGDTILVHTGIYRERVIPLRGGVTYLAEPAWSVFIKGSALWRPGWQSEGSGIFWAEPADTLFDDVPTDYLDSHNPFRTPLCVSPFGILGGMENGGDTTLHYTLGQIFVNGEMYTEVGKKSLLVKDKLWWYDTGSNRLYIRFGSVDPASQEVEITVRRRVFAPLQETGIENITLQGFIIEHCGNQYPDRFQKSGFEQNIISGAVGIRNNNGWIIRDCMVRYAKTIGIDAIAVCNSCDGPTGILIERCYVVSNGQTGIFCRRASNSEFRENVIMFNNALEFGKTKPHAKSTAGFKGLGGFKNNLIESNYFADNRSHGLWFDLNASNNTITRNVFVDNEEDAFYVELGGEEYDKNFFSSNLVLGGNYENSSLRYADCGGLTCLHNLIIDHPSGTGDNVAGFYGKTFNADRKENGYKYTVGNFTFYNNLWIGVEMPYGHPYPDHYSAPSKFDHNVYTGSDTMRMFGIHRFCGSPWPYTTDEVAELVHQDLGDVSPGKETLNLGNLIGLTFREWQEFWRTYGTTADGNSRLSPGSTASYDREKLVVTLHVDFDPSLVGSSDHPHAGKSFQGLSIPQDGKALPGAFQDLKPGMNTYHVWSGIPVLKEGQLPDNVTTAIMHGKWLESEEPMISRIEYRQNELVTNIMVKRKNECTVMICDLTGKTVAVLFSGTREAGMYQFSWDRSTLVPGCYILSIQSGSNMDGELFYIR